MIAETLPSPEVNLEAPASEAAPKPIDAEFPSKPAKASRRRHVIEMHVRPWEVDYPPEAKSTISLQRRELHQANLAARRANLLIKHLRGELRLAQRVFRLKHEAKLEGVAQAIDRLETERRQG